MTPFRSQFGAAAGGRGRHFHSVVALCRPPEQLARLAVTTQSARVTLIMMVTIRRESRPPELEKKRRGAGAAAAATIVFSPKPPPRRPITISTQTFNWSDWCWWWWWLFASTKGPHSTSFSRSSSQNQEDADRRPPAVRQRNRICQGAPPLVLSVDSHR